MVDPALDENFPLESLASGFWDVYRRLSNGQHSEEAADAFAAAVDAYDRLFEAWWNDDSPGYREALDSFDVAMTQLNVVVHAEGATWDERFIWAWDPFVSRAMDVSAEGQASHR